MVGLFFGGVLVSFLFVIEAIKRNGWEVSIVLCLRTPFCLIWGHVQ